MARCVHVWRHGAHACAQVPWLTAGTVGWWVYGSWDCLCVHAHVRMCACHACLSVRAHAHARALHMYACAYVCKCMCVCASTQSVRMHVCA